MWQVATLAALLALMAGLSDAMATGGLAHLITGTGFVLLAAFTMGELFRKIRLPALLGYIAAGILFGPDVVALFSEIGFVERFLEWRFGPGATLALLPEDITAADKLAYVEVLTVGVIGTLGGGELEVEALRDQVGAIARVIGLAFVAIVPLTGCAVYLLSIYAPEMVPFLQGVETSSRIAASVLFGVLGFAMSPAATLAIIQENRSEGPYTSLVLGVVMVADLVLVASFLVGKSFSTILVEQGSLAMGPVLDSLPGIGAEFGWAIVIGVATGAAFILYFRFVAREMLVFTVGMIFVASYASQQLHAERLLAFITAGFIVQNFSRHGHDMIEALERISLPVFVVYFTLQAVGLNVLEMPQFLGIIAILTIVRSAALFGSINLATRLGDWAISEDDREYLWLSFFSRGGVDLVLAALLAQPGGPFAWGTQFQTVIMGVVVVHIVIGPPLLKFALDRVGETQEERERESRDDELIEEEPAVGEHEEFVDEPFPVPDFRDDELHRHVGRLRDDLQELYHREFVQPVRSHRESMSRIQERIDTAVDDAADDLEELLADLCARRDPDVEEALEAIRRRHAELRQALQPPIEMLEQLGPTPVTPESIDRLLREVRGMERFDRHFRVECGPRHWEPSPEDSLGVRALKQLRRIRKAVFGPSTRGVAVGRLWRYYVELSLPEYLAGAVATTSEESERYWFELATQLRETDALFETTLNYLAGEEGDEEETGSEAATRESEEAGEGPSIPMSTSGARVPGLDAIDVPDRLREAIVATGVLDEPDIEDEDEENEEGESTSASLERDPARCLERLRRIRSEFEVRRERLQAARNSFRNRLLDRLAVAFENAFSEFLSGVEHAGTIRLPGFRYRPSRRFDRARRAEERLDERLRRQYELVDGCQGWIVVDQYLTLFFHWFREYRGRAKGMLDRHVRRGALQRMSHLETLCAERPEGWKPPEEEAPEGGTEREDAESTEIDWRAWYDDEISPTIQRTRDALSRALQEVGEGRTTRTLLDVLERRVSRFPESIPMLAEWPEEGLPAGGDVELEEVPLRRWFMAELIRETALRFVDFNERAERTLRRSMLALEDIQEILVFNLRRGPDRLDEETTPGTVAETAEGGLERAVERLRQLETSLREDDDALRTWLGEELSRIVTSASAPFLARRVTDLREQLVRRPTGRKKRRGGFRALTRPFRRAWRRVRGWLHPLYRDLRHGLEEALTEEQPAPDRGEVRERLFAGSRPEAEPIPGVYRRLFTPVPIEIPDFYIRRPDLEERCLEAVRQWERRERASLLLYGDRGTGKRTLTEHLLPVEVLEAAPSLEEDRIQTVRVGDRPGDERAICRAFAPLVGGDEVRSLTTLASELHSQNRRQIVCVEDFHNLFHRTPRGLARLERFLEFTSVTSDDVFWCFLAGRSAAEYLETAVDLFDYFTHPLEVEPFHAKTIERMILTRHRVSGFHLSFESPESRLVDRLRHPVAAAEAARHPRRAYFDRLGRLSGGNPMLALLYWLESVQPDPEDPTQFRVDPLPRRELDLLPALSIEQRLVLASLVRHRYASVTDLAAVFRVEEREMQVELEHLQRLGFVETAPGRGKRYRLRRLAEGIVTRELRNSNLV